MSLTIEIRSGAMGVFNYCIVFCTPATQAL